MEESGGDRPADQAKRKWIVLFGLNRFNKLPLYSKCNSCVYSIRWPFSSRELVKKGVAQHSRPIKLVVVIDRIHLVYNAHITILSAIGFHGVYVFLGFCFRFTTPTTTNTVHFAIINITVAHVQLPPPRKLPFVWLFHLYSIVSCLQNAPSYPLAHTATEHKIANLPVCVSVCMHAWVCICFAFLGKTKATTKTFLLRIEIAQRIPWSNWIKHFHFEFNILCIIIVAIYLYRIGVQCESESKTEMA